MLDNGNTRSAIGYGMWTCGISCSLTCFKAPVVCATTGFYGSGANLTGLPAGVTNNNQLTNGCGYTSNAAYCATCCAVSPVICGTTCVVGPIFCGGLCSCSSSANMHLGCNQLYLNTIGPIPSFLGSTTKLQLRVMNSAGSADIGYVKFTTNAEATFGISVNTSSNECSRLTITTGGAVNIPGSLSKGSGCFLIPHPDPEKEARMNLSHSFVESPTEGDNIYRWQVSTQSGKTIIELPSYYKHLNKNDMVWVSPYRHFGSAYGEVTADQCCVIICSNEDGQYNILLIGTRKDKHVRGWKGVETAR